MDALSIANRPESARQQNSGLRRDITSLSAPRLPPEVLDIVFKHLTTKQELKILRLVSKAGSISATPRLLRMLTIYPDMVSFTKLESIAKSPHLISYVQQILYSMKYIDTSEDDFLSSLHYAALPWYNGSPTHTLQATITHCLVNFPNVNSILVDGQVLPASTNINDFDQEYRSSNRKYCFHIASLLLVASKCPKITTLEIDMQILRVLRQELYLRSLFDPNELDLGALQTLKIRDVHPKLTRKVLPGEGLQYLLKTATNLKSFTLQLRNSDEMTDFGTRSHHFDPSMFGRSNPNPYLTPSTKLRHLGLKGVSCKMSEFRTILTNCRTTLKSLELCNFVLMPEIRADSRACLVSMVKYLQTNLKLEKVCLEGHLRNCGLQQWVLRPTPEDLNSLRERVQAFVIHGGSCPIEHFSIQTHYYDLMCRYSQRQVPPILLESTFAGDASLVPTYEVIDAMKTWPAPDDDPTYSFL